MSEIMLLQCVTACHFISCRKGTEAP